MGLSGGGHPMRHCMTAVGAGILCSFLFGCGKSTQTTSALPKTTVPDELNIYRFCNEESEAGYIRLIEANQSKIDYEMNYYRGNGFPINKYMAYLSECNDKLRMR